MTEPIFKDQEFYDTAIKIGQENNKLEDEKARAEEEKQRLELEEKQKEEEEQNDVGEELRNAFTGGLRDTASSLITLPERAQDMFSGEMAAEGEDYEPEFNPLGGDLNPVTQTWWGNAIRSAVHFGSLAVGVVAGAKVVAAAGIGGGISAGASWLAGVGTAGFGGTVVRGAAIGAASDLMSEYSQDHNMMGSLKEHVPLLDTPLATKDTDHPMVKTLKNVVEGMGIGIIADGLVGAIGRSRGASPTPVAAKPDRQALIDADAVTGLQRAKAEEAAKTAVDKLLRQDTALYLQKQGVDFKKLSPDLQLEQMLATKKRSKSNKYSTWNPPETAEQRASRKVEERNKSVEDQTIEKGRVEMEDEGFRGHKNKPIADAHQGSPNSMGDVYEVQKQTSRIHKDWGSENGSTDNILTPKQAERIANEGFEGNTTLVQDLARELYGEVRFKALREDLQRQGRSLDEFFADSLESAQIIAGGRDAGSEVPRDFWRRIFESDPAQTGTGAGGKSENIQYWSIENVVAADLVNTALFRKLRDLSIASTEIRSVLDITDVDGPVKSIYDNLIVGLTETKRSRYIISREFNSLKAQDPRAARKAYEQTLSEIHSTTKDQVAMMFDLARQAPTDDFMHAVLEAFSMSNNITNWTDFDAFMRRRLMGETTESGVKKTGILIRELQGVMINSVLSGPKTPMRAIMGTSTAVFTRPMAQMLGGIATYVGTGFKDSGTLRTALASTNAMVQTVPEAAKYFKARLNAYWSGEVSSIRSRYAEYNQADEQWELMKHWAETRGTQGEKAAFRVANLSRSLNDNNFLTYSSKLMAATDDAFTMILARARAKERAMMAAFDAKGQGVIPEITPDLIKEIESREYAQIFDAADGSISDDMLKYAKEEATLTKDVTGFGKSMDALFDTQPLLKPFYLFARTGINGLEFSFKHVPGLNFLVKEFNDIAFAKPGNLDNVRQYGITNDFELANAKALQNGRLAIGGSVVFMASQHYLNGNLTGNGPQDASLRRVWEAAGWKPRSIKLGDVWISYDSLEPFSNVLAAIADVGDNQRLMGDQWVEQNLAGISMIVAKGAVSKTYLQGLQQIFDLFGNDPKKFEKIGASLANNTVPLSSLRNEIGRLINPQMRELSSSWDDQIRNRNLMMEGLAEEQLPIKYDILNGEPIRDWDWPTRAFNFISPVQLNFDQSPGRQLLLRSNYDLRMSVYSAPDGTSLADVPKVRSLFQKAIGDQNLEAELNKLATDKMVLESIDLMEADLASGRKGKDPMSYRHNLIIKNRIDNARRRAWGSIRNDADVINLINARKNIKGSKFTQRSDSERSNELYDQAQEILKMYR
jgi:hypothetical protein